MENTRWVSFDIKFTSQGFENAWCYCEACWDTENTRWVYIFDIKFNRQGFQNACWYPKDCQAIQHAFSKPYLVSLISKDVNLLFFYQLIYLQQREHSCKILYICNKGSTHITRKCHNLRSQVNWWQLQHFHTEYIENYRGVSFDIKFTRQDFENACWHRISLPSWFTLQTSEYDVMIDFCDDSASLATWFKTCNVIMTW